MLKIYACVTHGINAAASEALLSGLSAGLRERILGTKNETHKLERICAYALLDKLFTDSGYRKERVIRTDKLGKPYIEGMRLRFSLCHTVGLSLAAVCDEFEIGVDAELIKSEFVERTASVCRRFFPFSKIRSPPKCSKSSPRPSTCAKTPPPHIWANRSPFRTEG